MSNRERVRLAIDAATDTSNNLRTQLPAGDTEARLLAAIDGWGRGLAAGLEELAVAVDEVNRLLREARKPVPPPPPPVQPAVESSTRDDREEHDEREPSDATVEQMHARAAASRRETASLRQETSDKDQLKDADSLPAEGQNRNESSEPAD